MASFDFKKTEERILDFWEKQNIFKKSIEQRAGAKPFVFFEGPPTANGRTHIGHFLTRIFKDLYGRYKTMQGHYVLRKAGWDTHGLPVELEVEKELGFKNKKQIEEYGVAAFNKKAKESVWKYKHEWEVMTRRMGFWVDFDDAYVTYHTAYIESAWAVIKKIADRDLLYQAHRVVPFCTRCGTALSSHEVAQGYKTVTDNSVFVKFQLIGEKFPQPIFVLAWTTTPWTLPGNVALAVGKDIEYVLVKKPASAGGDDEHYILARERLEKVLEAPYEILETMQGKDLVGLQYEPLFDVEALAVPGSYQIYDADFVSTTDGTGVVHTAVMYGEDDYNLGTKLNLVKQHTVDLAGKFVGVNDELNGKFVKAAATEQIILEALKQRNNLLRLEPYEHEYPFCWRCDTPLLYYAKSSWFIKTSAVNAELVANNEQINWYPDHIKHGRFGQWIKEGKDWAFSRERYWGTPLPVWKCADASCAKRMVVGSLEDLENNRVTKPNTFFLLRHGTSTKNSLNDADGIISSHLEHDTYDLTQEGREQIVEQAKRLKLIGVDMIVTSPFRRTEQSAQIIAETLGIPYTTDERLGELNHGLACEGKTHKECKVPVVLLDMDSTFGDGESWRQSKTRMFAVAQELNKKYEGKKVVIVGHGDPLWLLDGCLQGLTDKQLIEQRDKNYLAQGMMREHVFKNYPYNDEGEVDPHRPYVDEIVLKCDSCGGQMHKVPDLIDVWFDSGAMPYAQWHWPFENKETFDQQFPADFIVEAIDQTRGWFYTLLVVSTMLGKGPAYKNVMVLGHTLDEKGQKMSKSKGNVVRSEDFMDKVGVDTVRWQLYRMSAPEESKVIALKDFEDCLKGFMGTLQNCIRFYELYEKEGGSVGLTDNENKKHLLDQWVWSRWHHVVAEVTKHLEEYDPTNATRVIERFVVEDLSQWWLRRSRKRPEALALLRTLLLEIAKLLAPFMPYTTEDMHQRLGGNREGKESIHLEDWPISDEKQLNDSLEKDMAEVQMHITAGLALRKEHQLKVRQPLQSISIPRVTPFEADLEELIQDELNVKQVLYMKPNENLILDTTLTPELTSEGFAREAMRQIQDMRKEIGYRFDDVVHAQWHTEDTELRDALTHWSDRIQKETYLSEFMPVAEASQGSDLEKKFELAPGKHLWLSLKK